MNSENVLILGAGVSGLTTALKLLQSGHRVTVWSKEPDGQSPTTSFNAYAMWVPVKDDSDPRLEQWASESFSELEKLSFARETGVAMRKIFSLKGKQEEPWYAQSFARFRHALPGEISPQYADAHVLDTAPVIDPAVYLPWLHAQVVAAGGRFAQREVKQLTDCPAEFAAVVNCTSLGSRQLAGDSKLFAVRVQVVKIKPNGFDRVVIDDEGPNKRACIVPHADYIKLGGVFDEGDESLAVDGAATRDILARCGRMVPGFKADLSDILSVTRALRPERPTVRVELDRLPDSRPIIHNYGLDGMGYILSYGIASTVDGYLR